MPRIKGKQTAQVQQRLRTVDEMLKQVMPTREIERELSQRWKTTRRTIRRYIATVYKDWAVARDKDPAYADPEIERDRTVLAFSEIYTRALRERKYRDAIIAIDRRAHYLGLEPARRIKIDPDDTPVSVADARAILLAALDKQAITANPPDPLDTDPTPPELKGEGDSQAA